ncbi:MAG: PKD domain-containing protein, partial [Thermoplasmatota archaeon]
VPSEYPSIQVAIDAANESDTIYVSSGTYNENVIINKSLTLTGEESSNTIISGSGTHTIQVTSNNVAISGFKIQNTDSDKACIFLSLVTSCIISSNIVKNGGNGIYLVNSNSITIANNTAIESNNIGIYLSNSNNNEIRGNNISNNNVNGIFLYSNSNNNTIYLNDFSNNVASNARDMNTNLWSYNQQGNYWDDYNDYDMNHDGIGDSPYIIDEDSKDMYPLGDFLSYNQKPIAYIDSISPNSANLGQTVSFHGHGTDDGVIIGWQWTSSKNGILGTSADITTSSLSVGSHTISFRVQDNDLDWSDYAIQILLINDPSTEENEQPEATIVTIDPGNSIEGESVYFHGYGVDTDGIVTGYAWRSSRDGDLSSSSSCTLTTLTAGSHTIYFKVRDNDGDWSSEVTRQITVEENTSKDVLPIAFIECSTTGIVNQSVRFDASKSNIPGVSNPVLSYSWSFGDGTSGSGQIITHSYPLIGNYTVTLWIEDSSNHKSSMTVDVSISEFSFNNDVNDNSTDMDNESNKKTPGFHVVLLLLSSSLIALLRRRMKKLA